MLDDAEQKPEDRSDRGCPLILAHRLRCQKFLNDRYRIPLAVFFGSPSSAVRTNMQPEIANFPIKHRKIVRLTPVVRLVVRQ